MAEFNSTGNSSRADSRGRLLVSTKSAARGRKAVTLVICIALFLVGIFVMVNGEVFYKLSHQHYRLIAAALGILIFAYALYMLLAAFMGGRSYCEVYEHAVSGMTALSRSQSGAPMQKFDLSYGDIKNVTETGKTICIYTPYSQYEVLALHNRAEAVSEIRKHIIGSGK